MLFCIVQEDKSWDYHVINMDSMYLREELHVSALYLFALRQNVIYILIKNKCDKWKQNQINDYKCLSQIIAYQINDWF